MSARSTGGARRVGAGVVVAAALAVAACTGRDRPIPAEEPDHRPSDGLLGDAALQAVVEAQEARATAPLVRWLSDPRPAVRARAAFALGSVQDTGAVPALLRALSDSAPAVRRDAAFALGQAASADAIGPLEQLYRSEVDDEVRRHVLQALGKIPHPRASLALVGLDVSPALEPDRTLALAVVGAVGMVIVPPGLDQLLDHLDALDPRVRVAAAYYFGRVRATDTWASQVARVREALDGYGKDDPAAMYLVQALGRLGDPFDQPRLAEWASTARDWRTRANALAALGGEELDAGGRAALFEGLDDEPGLVAVSAAQSLAQARVPRREVQRLEAWIDAHPGRWQVVEPLLPLLARAGERDYLLGWIDALAAEDERRREIGLRALAFLPGDEARLRLARAAGTDTGGVAGVAVEALARRWPAERSNAAAPPFYLGIFSAALRSGDAREMATAAAALADSAFLPLGSVDTLRAALARTQAASDEEVAGALRDVLTTLTGEAPPPADVAAPQQTPTPTDSAASEPNPAALDWAYLAALGPAPRLVLDTEKGRVVVRLATEEAPLTVQTIARLADAGRYDGVPFHRVVPNFVVQGGDFARGDGYGGPGFTIRSELTLIRYRRGVIGMASAGKDTEGSQFFITHSMQPHLNGGYTAFGWVLEGMDVVDRLMVGDRIQRASVERGS